jgi:hypothetical protein
MRCVLSTETSKAATASLSVCKGVLAEDMFFCVEMCLLEV